MHLFSMGMHIFILSFSHDSFIYHECQSITQDMDVNNMMLNKKMMMVTEITSKEELDEMKTILEIFVVKNRIRELADQT